MGRCRWRNCRCSLVHELSAVAGAVGKQTLDSRPTLSEGVENLLCACGAGIVRRGRIDRERPSVHVDDDMALAPADPRAGMLAAHLRVPGAFAPANAKTTRSTLIFRRSGLSERARRSSRSQPSGHDSLGAAGTPIRSHKRKNRI